MGLRSLGGSPRVCERFLRRVGPERSGHYFICSFSSCGDDLGQWRAYADNGRGYALGFDGRVLENGYTRTATPNTEAFYVTYGDAVLDKTLDQIIEAYLRMPNLERVLRSGVSAEGLADLYTWLSVYLYVLRRSSNTRHTPTKGNAGSWSTLRQGQRRPT